MFARVACNMRLQHGLQDSRNEPESFDVNPMISDIHKICKVIMPMKCLVWLTESG